jgi:hypothetical protein
MRATLLFLLLTLGLGDAAAFEPTPEQVAIQARFKDGLDSGDHAKAFDNLEALVKSFEGQVTAEEIQPLRDLLVTVCFEGLNQDASDDRFSPEWLSRADRVHPPLDVTSPNWISYGAVQLYLAVGRLNQGRKAEARVALEAARSTFARARPGRGGDVSVFDSVLATVDAALSDELGVGDYITNQGLTQRFIGKVLETNPSTYKVRVTYRASGEAWERGQEVTVTRAEVKPLGALSIDALLAGWR